MHRTEIRIREDVWTLDLNEAPGEFGVEYVQMMAPFVDAMMGRNLYGDPNDRVLTTKARDILMSVLAGAPLEWLNARWWMRTIRNFSKAHCRGGVVPILQYTDGELRFTGASIWGDEVKTFDVPCWDIDLPSWMSEGLPTLTACATSSDILLSGLGAIRSTLPDIVS